MSHPYSDFILRFSALLEEARRLPHGGFAPAAPPPPPPGAPRALILAPHPDDECIVGGLALRLQRENGWSVSAAAVTHGSRPERRGPRGEELAAACRFLGWDRAELPGGPRSGVAPAARAADPARWASSADAVAKVLEARKPRLVFLPHAKDANATHQGVHLLVLDALRALGPSSACLVAETEYWGGLAEPNLMVESSEKDAADLVAALSFHSGEVERNPYHALLPCWLADNVRRGAELVGAQGGEAPPFRFATLYRLRLWDGKDFQPAAPGRCLAAGAALGAPFA